MVKKVNFPFSKELKILFKYLNKDDSLRVVGGCVRDLLNNQEILSPNSELTKIKDIDIACKYKPEETIKILRDNKIKVVPTGIAHGTVTAIIGKESFEITTLRKDVQNYGRKAKVEFIDDFLEDARRRDFTINAMSIDEDGNLFDYFNGYNDLKNNKVIFIGEASKRIEEDYLRILRFFRFSCRYASEIDSSTLQEIVKSKDQLESLSSHRIRGEFIKTIDCDNKDSLVKILDMMQNNNILSKILLFDNYKIEYLSNLLNSQSSLKQKAGYLLKFSALIYSNKAKAREVIDFLQFSNKEKKYIIDIIDFSSDVSLDSSQNDIIKLLYDIPKNIVVDALILSSCVNRKDNNFDIDKFVKIRDFIKKIDLPEFIINGNDLLDLNIESKEIGNTLNKLRDIWIESDFKMAKDDLIQYVKK